MTEQAQPPAEAAPPSPGTRSLTEGSIARNLLSIAVPTSGGFFAHVSLGIADMFFVGKLGHEAVAAVTMSGIMFGIIMMVGLGIAAGTTALVANAVGRGDRARAEAVVAQSLTMAAILSVVVAAVGLLLAHDLLRLFGADEEVAALGAGYLRIVAGGCIMMMLMMVFGASLRAAGDAKTPFMAMVLGNVVNIVLDPIFIFGWLGMPALGVPGSAWATLVGRMAALAVMIQVFFGGRHEQFHLHLRDLKPRPADMGRIASLGLYASGRMLLRNVGGLLLMRLVATFGTVSVAAFGICMRLQMVVFGPSIGFGTAAAAMVGQNVGAGRPERAERSAWVAVGLAVAIVSCVSTAFWFAGRPLVAFFNDEPEVVALGASLLRWFSFSFIFLSMSFVLSHAMTGGGDTILPMVTVAVSLIFFTVPVAYWLSHAWGGVDGVWAAMAGGNVLAGVLAAAAFRLGYWRVTGEQIRQGRGV